MTGTVDTPTDGVTQAQTPSSQEKTHIVQATQDEILRLSGRMSQLVGNEYRREAGSGVEKNPRY